LSKKSSRDGLPQSMNYDLTLVSLLRERAQRLPNQIAYTFLPDGETESGSLTYAQLDQLAQAIASHLQSIGKPGSRALVIYPYTDGLEFIAAFFGCLYAGFVAVTNNPPHSAKDLAKIYHRLQSSESVVILTTQGLLSHLKQQSRQYPEFEPLFTQFPCIATDILPQSPASDWIEPQLTPDDLAFLQYTSGSTGTPKGVMVTHRHVMHNSALIYQGFEHSSQSRGVMWLPLFHDMGLIGGVIQPLYGGFPVTLMSPVSLIQKPINWLKAISRYQATTSGGPNFAYDLLCRQIQPEQLETLDLSHWEVAFSGAEPVRAHTIEQFSEIFADCGFRREAFYPCYGMAETTLFITGGRRSEPPIIKYIEAKQLEENRVIEVTPEHPHSRPIVGCGQPNLGDEVIIVNPQTLTACTENEVGEIWVKGSGIGLGYWNQPEETEQMFRGFLGEKGPFLRTGDLGFLQDGELFITGRIKEMMILWGRNRYPQDLEQTAENSHPALRKSCGAAFSIEVNEEECLVIAYEVERSYLKSLNVEEIVTAIRQAIAEQHTVEVYGIVLLKTASLPKTSSGKIQRRTCRQQFLNGELAVVGEWMQNAEESSLQDLANRI
jgi:acyl-CoA synthetase (AMP-forming)/AMP-acid ligase II